MKRKTSGRIKWQACPSTASGCSWILAELIPLQLEDSKCQLCGWRSAHCREKALPSPSCKGRLPGFPGTPCPAGMRSKPVAGGGERDKRQAPAEVPWQWHRLQSGKEQSRPWSCQLLYHMSSQRARGRPAKSAERSSHVAGHAPRTHVPHAGPGVRRMPPLRSLSRSVCPFCPCLCLGDQRNECPDPV